MATMFLTTRARIITLLTLIITSLTMIPIMSFNVQAQNLLEVIDNTSEKDFYQIKQDYNRLWKDGNPGKGKGYKPYKRLEYFWDQRLKPGEAFPNAAELYKEWDKFYTVSKDRNKVLEANVWEPLGPTIRPSKNANYSQVGTGRVSCLTIDPNDNDVIWAGAATGGVWKSIDGGRNWLTFPFTEFLSLGISDIAVAPTNSDIVYAATGDADAGGSLGTVFNFSAGILKTSNGGQTWTRTALDVQQSNGILFNKLIVHPQNPNIVFASSNAGVFVTSDGGNQWFFIIQEYCRDLEMQPNNPNRLVGFFIANNGLRTIKVYNLQTNQWDTKAEFNDVLRMELDFSTANPNVIYGLACDAYGGFHSVIRSSNGGDGWSIVSDKSNTPNLLGWDANGQIQGGQGFYDLCITSSPNNENEVFLGGINLWKSTNGGASWNIAAYWVQNQGLPYVHPDHHDLDFVGSRLYSSHDGGINYTTNGGQTWVDISDGLQISQFYKVSPSESNNNIIIAGSQDNGTSKYQNGSWSNIFGGDGMDCQIDPTNPNIMYASGPNGEIWRSTNGGSSFEPSISTDQYGTKTNEYGYWVTPFEIDPNNSNTLYAGYESLWKSTNSGASWTKVSPKFSGATVRDLKIASADSKIIYVVTNYDGEYFRLFRTLDGGVNWSILINSGIPINAIEVDPDQPLRIWMALSAYSAPDKVYEFDGQQWTNITSNLPNFPVNSILLHKAGSKTLYIGTDVGVFKKNESKSTWDTYNEGLPNVIVTDMKYNKNSGKIRAATYGRGVWEVPVLSCNLEAPEVNVNGDLEFCEGGSVTLSVNGSYNKYLWSSGETTRSITVRESGDYSVTVYDNKGCEAESEVFKVKALTVRPCNVTYDSEKTPCNGDEYELSVSGLFVEYLWSNGETTKKIYIEESGEYWASAKYSSGCWSYSDTFNIDFSPSPAKPEITEVSKVLRATAADSYQWYFEGNQIVGAVKQTYEPTKDGTYQVEAFNIEGCSAISDEYEFVGTSIEQLKQAGISISPNPAESYVNIIVKNENMKNILIEVTNSIGELSYSYKQNVTGDFSKSINLNNFSSGAYFIRLKMNNEEFIHKLIVK